MLCRGKGKSKISIFLLLPVVLTVSLLVTGTVFADDSIMPETPAEETQKSSVSSSEEAADNPSADEAAGEDEQDSKESNDASADDQQAAENADETSDPSEVENWNSQVTPELQEEPAEEEAQDESSGAEDSSEEESSEARDEAEDRIGVEEQEEAEPSEENITLVDENGEAINMASQDSQEALSSADPYWYVDSVKYAYVKTGAACPSDADYCYESDTPISSALDYMIANNLSPSDGLLHVEADSYTENITVDGNSVFLKGIISEGTSSDTTITGTVSISNTVNGFTLSGFTILGSLNLNDNIGTITLEDVVVESSGITGISVTNHNGAVNIDRVAADNNDDYGLYIDNSDGTASVTISNSQFQFNQGGYGASSGLYIKTNGKITLEGISAYGNVGSGAILDALKGIVISQSVFSNNAYQGIYIGNSYTSNAVTINDTLINHNGYEGLFLTTGSCVVLDNVTASYNGDGSGKNGASINTQASSKATVKVSNSAFNNNYGYGLRVTAINNVTMSGITADSNQQGVFIDACVENAGVCQGTGKVTISGKQLNSFSNNSIYGLYISAGNSVYLSYFVADGNVTGVYISNDYEGSRGNVTLTLAYKPSKNFTNSISNNNNGMSIYSRGTISLQDLTISGTTGTFYSAAVILDNTNASSSKSVSVKNTDLYENAVSGLSIQSKGNVIIYNVNSYNNDSSGLSISTTDGSGSVKIYSSKSTIMNYTGNSLYSIYILSAGSISLDNIDGSGNSYGLYIDNTAGDKKKVDVSDSDFSDASVNYGINIISSGAITLSNVISNNNNFDGIMLDNTSSSNRQSVKLTNVESNSNTGGTGIRIDSLGAVTLKVISASSNFYGGLTIDNCQEDSGVCTSSASVKIYGSANEFVGNSDSGVTIQTGGSLTLLNITASSSSGYGVDVTADGKVSLSNIVTDENFLGINIFNTSTGTGQTVKLTNVESSSNTGGRGITISTLGSVILKDIISTSNSSSGLYIDNCQVDSGVCTSSASVKITGSANDFSNNVDTGISILSGGSISLVNISANSNTAGSGLKINQMYSTGTSSFKLSASKGYTNSFSNNYIFGLIIDSTGNVSLDNMAADGNGESGLYITASGKVTITNANTNSNISGGIYIDTTTYGTGQSLKLTNVEANSNTGWNGITINTLGSVSLKNITSILNFNSGLSVDSYQEESGVCTSSGIVTITNGIFSENSNTGISIVTGGNITLTNVSADSNTSGYGLEIDQTSSIGTPCVTIKASRGYINSFSNNGTTGDYDGLYIESPGVVSLSYIKADGNSRDGISVTAELGATLNKAQSFSNGTSTNDGSGLNLTVNTDAMVSLKYSAFSANYGNGISITGNTNPNLYKTYYFGNDIDNDEDDNLNLS